jgi:glucose/arabinose dehydrogenase
MSITHGKGRAATPAHNRVARYTASVDDKGNVVAEPGSWKLLLRLANLRATNHNGGAIHFGSDGKLYVTVGENARQELAQSLKTRLGKILRINKDGTISTDNPFYDRAPGSAKAIWARRLRNPYSFNVQPGTGKIFINDVGRKTWEEINEGEAGANYGWPRFEGPKNNANTEQPLFAYRHGFGEDTGCAITGGAFYNPATPSFGADLVGHYFFADFCTGWIRKLDSATNEATPFKSGSGERPVDLKVSREGNLYFLARGTGSVEQIAPSTPPASTP